MALKLKNILSNRKAELLNDAPSILESIYGFCQWCSCRRRREGKDECDGYDNPERARFMKEEVCELKKWFEKYQFVFPMEK